MAATPSPSAPLHLEFAQSLPVSGRREDIARAIDGHQVVIVCGETGSGKTTQLPKILLGMGRGSVNHPGQRGHLIGHTQPRRVAASSVAKRIAEELKTPLGEVVGYKVRFQDRLAPGASVKLMTDGILLAETQTDPLLRAYDTLIIDEAHERSLNIDFLLGYLRQLLPRRPDLKLIITSATIDAQRFADYFAQPGRPKAEHAPSGGSYPRSGEAWGPEPAAPPGRPKAEHAPSGGSDPRSGGAWGPLTPAPVIMVSGRTYPVEMRYRPFEESREHDLNDALADAVDELWRGGAQAGDILVFLPGEREIREAADHLRKHLAHQPVLRTAEVLPLFSRLSQAEQDRIFEPHGGRRIVLATNVAETSLTVPGIRFVIDSGTARVKRYSFRSKVEQLLVEPISQAAANQRAGRCGRVAEGICIRLYDEQDFQGRPPFTDPEILRSSLASVILRMKALRLGSVEEFAFIEPPQRRAITDGYQLLGELGAVDDFNELTPIGQALARLPLDPRVGRMLLEARDRRALQEVLVIASALSVQDVRDRPLDKQAQADQRHAQFDDEKSEFVSYLRLWDWLHHARGGLPARAMPARGLGQRESAATAVDPGHKLSNRQYENLLREHYINVRRVREWRDIHSQLVSVVGEQGWKPNLEPASYEQLHLSMLSGLLGNIGCKSDEEDFYLGARGIKFHRHPGSRLSKRPGRWIVAAELVETTRLFGRCMAAIEPQWLEQVGSHLLKKQLLDPHWEKKAARVSALERATLYGLVIYNNRRADYGAIDPAGAREIFIRQALVGDQWESKLPFLAANHKLIAQVQELEHKQRRQDVLVDDELIFAFYDGQVPAEIHNGAAFERWWKDASRAQPRLMFLSREELMRHEAAGITTQAFPRTVRLGGVDCSASYLHEPGDPKDGVTVDVPLFVLNQVSEERCEWLVPGMLKDKIQALLKSLPQKSRGRFVPLPESAARLAAELSVPEVFGDGFLTDALLKKVRQETSLDIKRNDFKLDMLSAHLFMNLRVVDEHGRQLAMGRNLGALKAEWGSKARGAFQALAQLKDKLGSEKLGSEKLGSDPNFGGPEQAARPKALPTAVAAAPSGAQPAAHKAEQRYVDWSFGELPELMEIGKGGQTLIGFPALVDVGDAVTLEVFDEPDLAAAKHRKGLGRLFALQTKDALKYLEKNLPDLQKMSVAYMSLGTADELKAQIIEVAVARAFLQEPLPTDQAGFKKRVEEGRGRLTLIANEVARLASVILAEYATAARKIKDTKNAPDATADCSQQLQRLLPKHFMATTPWPQLQHFARYLKAITLRLDKHRADPARDAQRLSELRPQDQRYWRLVAERKGVQDERMLEFRWLLEELRVSFFAQELRTPQPVSLKRLDKAWAQLTH